MTMQKWEQKPATWPLSGQASLMVHAKVGTWPVPQQVARKARIVIVEDGADTLKALSSSLSRAGYEVHTAQDGLSGWQLIENVKPHLVVLDEVMSGMDGWVLCRRIRETDDTLVMLVSAKTEKADRVRGYMCGCDDYVTKPCDVEELLARTRALLRRVGKEGQLDTTVALDGGRVQIHLDKQRVTAGGQMVDLTSTEYRILTCLASKRGSVASHKDLLDAAWGGYGVVQEESYSAGRDEIKVYISYLRRKLGDSAREPRIIQTVRTMGYRLADGDQ